MYVCWRTITIVNCWCLDGFFTQIYAHVTRYCVHGNIHVWKWGIEYTLETGAHWLWVKCVNLSRINKISVVRLQHTFIYFMPFLHGKCSLVSCSLIHLKGIGHEKIKLGIYSERGTLFSSSCTYTGCPKKMSTPNLATFKPGFSQILIRNLLKSWSVFISPKSVKRIRSYDYFCPTGSNRTSKGDNKKW